MRFTLSRKWALWKGGYFRSEEAGGILVCWDYSDHFEKASRTALSYSETFGPRNKRTKAYLRALTQVLGFSSINARHIQHLEEKGVNIGLFIDNMGYGHASAVYEGEFGFQFTFTSDILCRCSG